MQRESARLLTEIESTILAAPRVEAAVGEAKKRIADSVLAFRSAAQQELAETNAQLERITQTLPALEDRVTRTEVRSPVRGIVKVIANKTPGGVVQAGAPLAEIVSSEDSPLFEARVQPADIGFVAVGQRAVMKIAAYDYSIYGGIEGKVEHISADSIQPQQAGVVSEPFFLAHVRTEKGAVEFQGKVLPITSGMTGVADVVTGRKTVLQYLLKPVNKARERALTER